MEEKQWFDDYYKEEDEIQINEYDITASPNDFNVITLYNFIESGAIKIPAFQRNYVWDRRRASKLIESLILGLPVPQLFLYEESRNSFLVIDGQQRLLSIYYFMKQRFPRKEKRVELRRIFDKHSKIPENIFNDDAYFTPFKLDLPERLPDHRNKFKGRVYSNLGEYKNQFDLRPLRNITVKQNAPKDDDSCVYEIFNRLNTGGINLKAQEIRSSLYHSGFYEMLDRINENARWRSFINKRDPDTHQKDVEILTRSFAMLIDGGRYKSPLMLFLNHFSKKCMTHSVEQNIYLEQLFNSFMNSCSQLPNDTFMSLKTKRFNIALFEATFVAACESAFLHGQLDIAPLDYNKIKLIENDAQFQNAASKSTSDVNNVNLRLRRAREILKNKE